MSAAALLTPSATSLRVGDRVMVRRDLDHPAWKHRIDGRDVGEVFIRRTDIPEEIGESEVSDMQTRRSHRLSPDGTLVYVSRAEVRVGAFWYDANTGIQVHSGATHISPVPPAATTTQETLS